MCLSLDLFCVGVLCSLLAKSCLTLVISWMVTCQTPLSMKFFQQEYWNGLSFPSPEDHPDPGIKPESWTQVSYTAGRFFTVEPPEKPLEFSVLHLIFFLFKSSRCVTLYLLNKNSHFSCDFFPPTAPHSLQDLSFSARDWTQATAVKILSLNHWTARELPCVCVNF